jgi:predicted metallo-beta-lactamase superfamily hydrolase
MCTKVQTRDVEILLDAGVALGPRFGLMPHPVEYKALKEARSRIQTAASTADVVTISHYHNDHHTPNYIDKVWLDTTPELSENIYKGKTVLVKDYRRNINTAQRRRGWMFAQAARKWADKFEVADGQTFNFKKTTVRFPNPVPHGESETELGWVLPCIIEKSREKIMFAPDVQGPVVESTLKLILDENPNLLILGGPPTYLKGYRISDDFFKNSLQCMAQIVREIKTIVIDHHLLRDEAWFDFLDPVRKLANESRHRLLTAAELLGQEPTPLEYRRKELYEREKPTDEFMKWAKLPEKKLNETPPPLEEGFP